MHFAILSSTDVTHQGEALPMPPIRRRALCALLAAGRHGLSAEALTEALWGDDDVEAHESSLKSVLSHLRRTLPDRIPPSTAGRYRIILAPGDALDVDQFRAKAAEGAAAAASGDYATVVNALNDALALWGEPPLADLPDHPSLRGFGDELLDERRTARLALLDAWLHLGEYQEVIREGRRDLAEDPLSEAVHALVMTALYRAGRRAEALQQYAAAASVLEKETGSAPGAALRRLRDQIAADEVGQADSRGAPRVVPAQLPRDVPYFTGREQEIEELVAVLSTPDALPMVAVSGPGGVGKSALAARVAHHVREAFPDGQLFTSLAAMSASPRTVSDVLAELLGSLGVPLETMPRADRERTTLLRSLLAGRRMLLVVDDVAGDHQVQPLLPGAPGCGVIVTSRVHLAEGITRRVHLTPLDLGEGLRLLAQIIGAERVQAEPDAAAALVQACDGFPLAIHLAGARLTSQPHWTLAYFADHLGHGIKARAGEHVSASEIIAAASYELLSDDAQKAFRALSMASNDFPAWVVSLLLGCDEAEEQVEVLVSNSLITPAGVDAYQQPRYRQHDLIRSYAAARLAEQPAERAEVRDRLLGGALEIAALANTHLQPDPHHPPAPPLADLGYASPRVRALVEVDPTAGLAMETSNVLEATRIACREGDALRAFQLALQINSHLFWARYLRDAEDMWRSVMRVCENAGEQVAAAESRLRVAALITRRPGGPERAIPMLDESITVFDELGDLSGLSRALGARAFAAWTFAVDNPQSPARRWMLEQAGEDCERGLPAARAAGDRYGEMACLRGLGMAMAAVGHAAEGISLCEEALAIARRIADYDGQLTYYTYTLRLLILVHLGIGEYERVLELLEEGRPIMAAYKHAAGDAAWAEIEGDALTGLGRHREAAERYAEAVRLYEGDAAPHHGERCQTKYGDAIARAGQLSV
ncbi:BTAD domain-containing putative transcriptional regulator [Microbispora corallina]|uniref:SARP family transcriptional regulator n=1 Tax=Microbispora corallina TaxID=83302 RepID=A0ABQ4GCP1_9ACTN|nr:BTAD domain-containing putative transcriptional regulator [Microbispora corallina]GIH44805.1 SARP family transcriptional regulator [Microbispora corallina]